MVQFHVPSTYTTYGILPPEPIAQPPQGWGKLLLVGQAKVCKLYKVEDCCRCLSNV